MKKSRAVTASFLSAAAVLLAGCSHRDCNDRADRNGCSSGHAGGYVGTGSSGSASQPSEGTQRGVFGASGEAHGAAAGGEGAGE